MAERVGTSCCWCWYATDDRKGRHRALARLFRKSPMQLGICRPLAKRMCSTSTIKLEASTFPLVDVLPDGNRELPVLRPSTALAIPTAILLCAYP